VHPYENLPPYALWTAASTDWRHGCVKDLYRPKFAITAGTRIGSGGSCFAQHIARALKARRFSYVDVEPPPSELPAQDRASFGFGLYSARYGNIYSSAQLLTMIEAALGLRDIDETWLRDGRYVDPMRPRIEPDGFSSAAEVAVLRRSHLCALRALMSELQVFVFTLGLTETWLNRRLGITYPMCPGTAGGVYDPTLHKFVNLGFREVYEQMERVLELWKRENPSIKIILTVSPVPLAATASGHHVVQATAHSKAVLRSVAGELCSNHAEVDYFPSYELVTSHLTAPVQYGADGRNVTNEAVLAVMNCFFAAQGQGQEASVPGAGLSEQAEDASPFQVQAERIRAMEVVCDEATLDRSAP
jgi:hypothetical protein